eukprot:TRINITY_DN17706_c1_g1_i1.p1 TRINITY_DN17706_c1_g1~~TRINITY_DN17706_c1_g1_i1.p1  ORF type:complete len:334 (+),score=48.92 TRINITY_DN17706_c1_g1_i1:292-1293(+)
MMLAKFLRGPAVTCLLSYLEATEQQRLANCFRILASDAHLTKFGRIVSRDALYVFQSWMDMYFIEFGRRVGKSLSAFTWQDRIALKRFMVEHGYGAAIADSRTGEPLLCHAARVNAPQVVCALLKSAEHGLAGLSALGKVAFVVHAARSGNCDMFCHILPFLGLPTLLLEELPDIAFEFSLKVSMERNYSAVTVRLRSTRLAHWILFASSLDSAVRSGEASTFNQNIGSLYTRIDFDALKFVLQKLVLLGMVINVPLQAEVSLEGWTDTRVWQQRVTPLEFVNLFFEESAVSIFQHFEHLSQVEADCVKLALRSFCLPAEGMRRMASALQELS